MRSQSVFLVALSVLLLTRSTHAAGELKPGDPAPPFTAKTSTGATFDLASRNGQWTVLYFYPRAGTSGCTAQARAYRDNMAAIRAQGAEVYGVSTDAVDSQAEFSEEHDLGFPLLADPDGTVVTAYGAKMPVVSMARRWTFIIGPDLRIRHIERDVDPELDAQRVARDLARLQGEPAPGEK